jgi:predicted nucleic acid-binding protein
MTRLTNSKPESCYLDSNVLIYFFDEASPFHQSAVRLIEKLVKDQVKIYLSPLVLDEVIYILVKLLKRQKTTHPHRLVRSLVKKIWLIPNARLINPPLGYQQQLKVIDLMEKYKLHSRDAYHLLIMLVFKIDYLATFDSDFRWVFKDKELNLKQLTVE